MPFWYMLVLIGDSSKQGNTHLTSQILHSPWCLALLLLPRLFWYQHGCCKRIPCAAKALLFHLEPCKFGCHNVTDLIYFHTMWCTYGYVCCITYLSFSGCINTSEAIIGRKPAISLSIGLVLMHVNRIQLTSSAKEHKRPYVKEKITDWT